jgi:hypothetical protein
MAVRSGRTLDATCAVAFVDKEVLQSLLAVPVGLAFAAA